MRHWLWVAALPLALLGWIREAPATLLPREVPGFAVLFPGYRHLATHHVNAPKGARKRIVVLGASGMAGWGTDYRGSLFDERHRHDIWGRTSLSASMEAELQRRGIDATVENLGINYGAICSELSIFLYSMERKPDLVIHGLTAGSFADFDLAKIPELVREIPARLGQYDYPDKDRLEASLLRLLKEHKRVGIPAATLAPTVQDSVVNSCGQLVVHAYRRIGLPPVVVKPEDPFPDPETLRGRFAQPADERVRAFMERGVTVFANMPVMMQRIAASRGVPYVPVFPPTLYTQDHLFYGERYGPMLSAQGLAPIDLSQLGLRYGSETYDGVHSTPAGNAIAARALVAQILERGLLK